ncbi:MAG: response regulator transcription factor [Acidimicrobiales bacterium]
MSTPRVLVIEDDTDIWRSLEILLGRAGYVTDWATDGVDGLDHFADEPPDLVVLDLGLPRLDGWAVLERLRQLGDVPILVLTARGMEQEKVRGLTSGADDYLTKPYGNEELVARVSSLLRRVPPAPLDTSVFDDGHVRIDFARGEVAVDGRQVALTPTELRLLAALVRHEGQVLSHDQLLELAWREPPGSGRGRIKFAVLGLRRRCGWTAAYTSPVRSVRGFGYRYTSPSSRTAGAGAPTGARRGRA